MTGKSEEEILATRQKEIEKIHQEIREMHQLDSKEDDIQVNIIDSYIDDECEDIDKVFEDVLNFLGKANATKKTVANLQEMIENEKKKAQN